MFKRKHTSAQSDSATFCHLCSTEATLNDDGRCRLGHQVVDPPTIEETPVPAAVVSMPESPSELDQEYTGKTSGPFEIVVVPLADDPDESLRDVATANDETDPTSAAEDMKLIEAASWFASGEEPQA